MKKIFFVAVVFLLGACSKHPEKVKQVDEMLMTAEKYLKDFKTIDGASFSDSKDEVLAVLTRFGKHLKEEWLSKEVVINDLSDYRSLKKPLKKLTTIYASSEKELVHRISQLRNLKKDIENGHFDSVEAIDAATFDEQERLGQVIGDVQYMLDHGSLILERKLKYQPLVDSLNLKIDKSLELE
jgi:hypothetical protein